MQRSKSKTTTTSNTKQKGHSNHTTVSDSTPSLSLSVILLLLSFAFCIPGENISGQRTEDPAAVVAVADEESRRSKVTAEEMAVIKLAKEKEKAPAE